MVGLHIDLVEAPLLDFARLPQKLGQTGRDGSFQHPAAILRCPRPGESGAGAGYARPPSSRWPQTQRRLVFVSGLFVSGLFVFGRREV